MTTWSEHSHLLAGFSVNVTKEMEFLSCDGRDDGDHSGVGFVETSKLFATNGACLSLMKLSDELKCYVYEI